MTTPLRVVTGSIVLPMSGALDGRSFQNDPIQRKISTALHTPSRSTLSMIGIPMRYDFISTSSSDAAASGVRRRKSPHSRPLWRRHDHVVEEHVVAVGAD